MYETVSFDNTLNKIPFRVLKSMEMDLFWAIASKIKGKDEQLLMIEFDDIRELSGWAGRMNSEEEFIQDLKNTADKLHAIRFDLKLPKGGFSLFYLFSSFIADAETGVLKIKISSDFAYLFTRAKEQGNFTEFDLKTIISLKSSYSKELYRRLMQFKRTGWWEVSIDDFRSQIGIPNSYKISDIDKRIFNIAVSELVPEFFNYLKITKKKGGYRNSQIVGFRFEFESKEFISDEQMKNITTRWKN
jgi:plasmid replication initiation protein